MKKAAEILQSVRKVSFWHDFKQFAFKGNLLDMAVAVIVGNAVGQVVNSLVKNILMPVVSYASGIAGKDGKIESYHQWHIGAVEIGPFLADLVHFLIVSLAMFVFVVKVFGTMKRLLGDSPSNKECPYCISQIPIRATRCPQCTADLDPEHADHREPVGAGSR